MYFKFRNLIFVIFTIALCSLNAVSQKLPKACHSFPPEYSYLKEDFVIGLAEVNCEQSGIKTLKLGTSPSSKITSGVIYFNLDETTTFDALQGGKEISEMQGASNLFTTGNNWVLITGVREGKKILSCRNFEFLPINSPKISADLCNASPLELLVTGINPLQSISINWGDGEIEHRRVDGNRLNLQHIPVREWEEIAVRTFYERNGVEVCASNEVKLSRDIPPPILLTSLEGLIDPSEIKIKYKGNLSDVYPIEISNPDSENWVEAAKAEAGEGTIIGLDPQQKYCFRISSENQCGEKFYSKNMLCNIVIEREVQSATAMKINWDLPKWPEGTPENMQLSKASANHVLMDNPNITEYLDQDLACGQKYSYQVFSRYPAILFNGVIETPTIKTSWIEKEISDTQLGSKPAFRGVASYDPVIDHQVNFSVLVDQEHKGQIAKIIYFQGSKNDFEALKLEESSQISTKVLLNKDSDVQTCFQYQFTDVCGISTGRSDSYCTIKLEFNEEELVWSSFDSFDLFQIEVGKPDEPLFKNWQTVFVDTTFQMADFLKAWEYPELKIRVSANQKQFPYPDGITVYSNTISHTFSPALIAPNAFTPDGVGPAGSEVFKPKVRFAKESKLNILNRLGNVVYSAPLDMGWNGTDNRLGKPVPIGSYFYIITALGFDDRVKTFKGSVILLK